MAEKTYLFKGLEVRSNQLEREGNTARDCSNVRLDQNNRLIKREEFSPLNLPKSVSSNPEDWLNELPLNGTIIDLMEYTESLGVGLGNQSWIMILVTYPELNGGGGTVYALYKYFPLTNTLDLIIPSAGYSSTNFVALGYGIKFVAFYPGKVTYFQKGKNLYFTIFSSSGSSIYVPNPMMKFDGDNWYQAGIEGELPTSADEGILTPPNYYVKSIPFYIDPSGLTILGESQINKYTAGPTITAATPSFLGIANTNMSGFVADDGTPTQTITNASLTLVAVSIQAQPGTHVLIYDQANSLFYRFRITSILAGVVTLSSPQYLEGSTWIDQFFAFSITVPQGLGISGMLQASYFSVDYSAGYQFGGIGGYFIFGITGLIFDPTAPNTVPEASIISEFFEDFYGDEIKGPPPPSLQIIEYSDGCLAIDEDFLYFSDLSINGTVENFTAFDSIKPGKEEDGRITSFFANETFIAICRERGTYLITGNIYTGNYRVQTYRTTGLGGVSPTSVISLNGQALFMSNRGPKAITENGGVLEIGDAIEPIFNEDIFSILPSLELTDVALDITKEYIYMFVPSGNGTEDDIVMALDYMKGQWFIYRDLNMRGGLLTLSRNKKIYYSDGSDVYVEQPLNTYTSGVDAYWRSNFETLGKASMKKRFQRLHLFLTSFLSTDILFKAYSDWNTVDAYTDQTITPSPTIPMDNKRCNPKLVYSNSFDIESTGTNILSVDGFEYSFEVEQQGLNDDVRQ